MQQPNTTIAENVLEKISKENVTPTSRWYFRTRHAILWLPGLVVTVFGSFAIAGILFSAVHAGWQYRDYVQESIFHLLSRAIPLLWVVSLCIFGIVIVKTLRLTARGYRYKAGAILFLSFLLSVVLGVGLFALDMVSANGNRIIRFQAERAQRAVWMAPEEGRLAGVVAIKGDTTTLTDSTGRDWLLDTSELVHPEVILADRSIRAIGIALDDRTFLLCAVFPWELAPFVRPTHRDDFSTPSLQPHTIVDRCASIMRANKAKPPSPTLLPEF